MNTYLFDFDGTLVDSMPVYTGAMLRIMDENGVPHDGRTVEIITPLGLEGTARYFLSLGMKASREALVARMKELMAEAYFHTIPAKPGAADALSALKARGDSLNVLTASPHVTLDACLKRLGLFGLFDNVWSCDDFEFTKSQPEIYIEAARRLGRSPDKLIFLDDNINACLAAKAAGLTVFGVYDESSAKSEDRMRAELDGYVRELTQVNQVNSEE